MQFVVIGLATGSLYALIALGLVLLYKTNRVLNFAHGDMATFATFIAFTLLTAQGLPIALAFGLAMLAGLALGAAFYLGLIRRAGEIDVLGQIIITIGFGLTLNGLARLLWGADTKPFPALFSPTVVYRIGDLAISQLAVGSAAVGIALMLGLYLVVHHSRLGLAMRALSQDEDAARALGVRAGPVNSLTWGIASALGAAAALMIAPAHFLNPNLMFDPLLMAFAGAVLGGINSLPGAVIGGYALGVAEALVGGFVSMEFKASFAFLVIIAVLVFRPHGLLGYEHRRRA